MAKVNRPWLISFHSSACSAKGTPRGFDQIHKLARNFCVSIDLGTPGVKLVEVMEDGPTTNMTGKEKYLLWVKGWKEFYFELSTLIRWAKKNLAQENRAELHRLKETAQVMLNARHVGKLASWAIVQRNLRLNGPMVLTAQLSAEQLKELRTSWTDTVVVPLK